MNSQSRQSAEMLGSDAGLLADPAESSTMNYSQYTHNIAPTRFAQVGGSRFVYRRFGNPVRTPVVLLQHFMGNLDNYDPAITDALAAGREVILTDNAGVGLSTGQAPETVAGMALGDVRPHPPRVPDLAGATSRYRAGTFRP
jgi:pimeloyl-ACP methyl ester carboxylesterase